MNCPWYLTARAVERFQALVPQASREFDDARDQLLDLAATIWHRYETNPELAPTITRTGAYQYRGPSPLRLVVIIAPAPAGGGKAPMVDVVGVDLRRVWAA